MKNAFVSLLQGATIVGLVFVIVFLVNKTIESSSVEASLTRPVIVIDDQWHVVKTITSNGSIEMWQGRCIYSITRQSFDCLIRPVVAGSDRMLGVIHATVVFQLPEPYSYNFIRFSKSIQRLCVNWERGVNLDMVVGIYFQSQLSWNRDYQADVETQSVEYTKNLQEVADAIGITVYKVTVNGFEEYGSLAPNT